MSDYTSIAIGIIAAIMLMVYVIGVTKVVQQRDRESRRVNLAALRRQFDRQPDEDEAVRALYAEHREGRIQ